MTSVWSGGAEQLSDEPFDLDADAVLDERSADALAGGDEFLGFRNDDGGGNLLG